MTDNWDEDVEMSKDDSWECGCTASMGRVGCGICGRCIRHCICGNFAEANPKTGDKGVVSQTKCSICGQHHTCITGFDGKARSSDS